MIQQATSSLATTPPATRNRGGALNALKNGSRSIARLPLNLLPPALSNQEANARKFRKALEAAVADARGEVGWMDAALINEAVVAEVHAATCAWAIRNRITTMSTADLVVCSKEILRSKEVRNKALSKLKLTRDAKDALIALYDTDVSDIKPNATQANVGDSGGESDGHPPATA